MATPTLVRTAVSQGDPSTAPSVTLTGLTAGQCVVLKIGVDAQASVSMPNTFTTDGTNAYSPVGTGTPLSGTACGGMAYVCPAVAAGSPTVTLAWSGTKPNFSELYVEVWSGCDPTTPIDPATIAYAAGNSSTASAGPVTTGRANEEGTAYCFTDSSSSGPGSGWTADSNSPTAYGSMDEMQSFPTISSSVTATTPLSGADVWMQMVFCMQPAPPAAPAAGLQYANRVRETTTTTGTGAIALGGAVTGYQAFGTALTDQQAAYYEIDDGTAWEVGRGTYTAGTDTLSRDVVLASSSSGAAISFGAGTKTVILTLPAEAYADKGLSSALMGRWVPG